MVNAMSCAVLGESSCLEFVVGTQSCDVVALLVEELLVEVNNVCGCFRAVAQMIYCCVSAEDVSNEHCVLVTTVTDWLDGTTDVDMNLLSGSIDEWGGIAKNDRTTPGFSQDAGFAGCRLRVTW